MLKHTFFVPGMACLAAIMSMGSAIGAERPTFKHNTRDPRPDILPHPVWDAHVEYRRAYNRPTFLGGWLAYKVSRTSQEAMVWQENVLAGNYDQKHMPPMYKRYYAPKPWEVLLTGPRPDFPEPRPNSAAPATLRTPAPVPQAEVTPLPTAIPEPVPQRELGEEAATQVAPSEMTLELSRNSSRRRAVR